MKRLLFFISTVLLLVSGASAQSQPSMDDMLNAQLRFIKEKAELSKKEYQSFAKIYIEYNKSLFELNESQVKPVEPGGVPFRMPTREEADAYMKRWKEINDTYVQKLEKQLSEDARRRIGKAQWELGQKIWKEWSERMEKEAARRIEEDRKKFEQYMEQADEQQKDWWENYWKQWGFAPAPPQQP